MKRVLVIEDQPEIRELIRMTLELEPLEVHEAADGETGLRMAQGLQPNLVLLDIMLPGGTDGYTVCERMRGDTRLKKTRIVLLTARSRPADEARGMQAGADQYLVKPFSPRHLLSVVGEMA